MPDSAADSTADKPSMTAGHERWRVAFARGASGTFLLRVFDAGVTIVLTLVLARVLGAAGFGVFSYAIAWAALLGVPALLGLEQLVVRGVAAADAQEQAGTARGMIRWSVRIVVVASLVMALLGGAAVWLFGGVPAGGEVAFWAAMVLVPLTALARVAQAAIRGLQHVVAGFLPELAVMPVLSLVLVGAGVLLMGPAFDAVAAVGAHVMAAAAGVATAMWLLRARLAARVPQAPAVTHGRSWLSATLPLLFISGAHVINRQTDVVMLGVLEGLTAAGVYAVAARGVQLITFVTYAVNAPLAPRIAALHATADVAGLQRVTTASARVILGFSLPPVVLFIVFGPWLLGFFGSEFTAGAPALAVLSLGQLAAAAAGPAGLTPLMTNLERAAAVGTGIGAAANLVLNLALIPAFGLVGAAAATALATAGTGVIHVWMVRRRLGINSTVIGPLRPRG